MLRFISFGSGSSGNCYFLFGENEGLMIDAGLGIRRIKKGFHDYGLSLGQVSAILVTHDHADHIKAAGVLSETFGIPVYSTAEVHEGILENKCAKRKIPIGNRRMVRKNTTLSIGRFEITPFGVPHDSKDNVGYRIVYGSTVFCLLTDVGHVTHEMEQMIAEANYLVVEANHDEAMLRIGPYPQYLKIRIANGSGHLNNRLCGEALAANLSDRIRHVWLCHLSEDNNTPQCAYDTVAGILQQKGWHPNVDFSLEVLPRKSPCGIFDLI